MADAMKWEELRVKVGLAAIGLVGAIVAFVVGNKQSLIEPRILLGVAAVLIMMIGTLSWILVYRYTQSFYGEYRLARAYRKAWLRRRDSAYVYRKADEADPKEDWKYALHLWPLGQCILVLIGAFLLAVAICCPAAVIQAPAL